MLPQVAVAVVAMMDGCLLHPRRQPSVLLVRPQVPLHTSTTVAAMAITLAQVGVAVDVTVAVVAVVDIVAVDAAVGVAVAGAA